MSVAIVEAKNTEQLGVVTALLMEYAKSMGEKLADSSLGKDLQEGLIRYSPPKGRLLLAVDDEEAVGCAGLSYIDEDTCELKRVYVKEILRGDGIGTQLSKTVLRHARWIGYKRAVLSVYRTNAAAIKLYERLGFTEVAPFKDNGINEQLCFMGYELSNGDQHL